jgi:plasmid stabilization system protein ParE
MSSYRYSSDANADVGEIVLYTFDRNPVASIVEPDFQSCFTTSLTSALSPRRGSRHRPSSDCSVTLLPNPAHDIPMNRRTIHPLPGGEGRGEGERSNHSRLDSVSTVRRGKESATLDPLPVLFRVFAQSQR